MLTSVVTARLAGIEGVGMGLLWGAGVGVIFISLWEFVIKDKVA